MTQPNLLFLISDQQQAQTLAPGSLCQTPHLDALARAGTHFTRCYPTNPACSPSRASLFTGLYPHSHGMVDVVHNVEPYRASLKPGLAFWPRTLQEAGYRTAYFGKWHIERSGRLEDFGFDVYETSKVDGGGEGYRDYRRRLGLDADERRYSHKRMVKQKGYRDLLLYGILDEPVEATYEYYLYEQGIRWLQTREDATQPWALFISVPGPHDPYIVPQAYYHRYDPAQIPQPPSFEDPLTDRPEVYRRMQSVWQDLQWQDFAEATACYYAFCSLIDDQVGRIMATLEQQAALDNTLIVYTSDHGDNMAAHRLMLKSISAFEEALKVPLILKGPGIPEGRQVDQVVSLLDIPRTMVEITLDAGFPCEGRSLVPILRTPKDPQWRSEAFFESHGIRFFYTQRVLIWDEYKYVFNGFAGDELYNLAQDPYEMTNLAADALYRPILEQMATRMWAIIHETNDTTMANAQYGTYRFAPVGPESAR